MWSENHPDHGLQAWDRRPGQLWGEQVAAEVALHHRGAICALKGVAEMPLRLLVTGGR